jgi:hypothetical protein
VVELASSDNGAFGLYSKRIRDIFVQREALIARHHARDSYWRTPNRGSGALLLFAESKATNTQNAILHKTLDLNEWMLPNSTP